MSDFNIQKEAERQIKELVINKNNKEELLISTSQIRRMYNPFIKIQNQLDSNSNSWESQLALLKPRITYLLYKSMPKKKEHKEKIQELHKRIMKKFEELESSKQKTKKTVELCHFMEALTAFHKQEEVHIANKH